MIESSVCEIRMALPEPLLRAISVLRGAALVSFRVGIGAAGSFPATPGVSS